MDSHRHFVVLALAFALTFTNYCEGQNRRKKVVVPDPERVLLETKDGVELRAEWFGGTKGKDSVPVIMIHDWDSDRSKLTKLARSLQQKEGYAVIVPDLRGHGESMTVKGSDKELDRDRFKKNELASFVEDIDTCRRFLQEKNDEGVLNLDLLSVFACGKMAIHAANWCITDWSWKPINGVKQGQNVKSLVLISPERRFKSLSMNQALKSPLFSSKSGALPLLMFWGEDNATSDKDGQAILKSLKKSRNEPEKFSWEDQTLFHVYYATDLRSGELIEDRPADIQDKMVQVIDNKVLENREDYQWQQRKVIKD